MPEEEAPHPDDHKPFWLFLRQEVREGGLMVDVFYCAHCLGRVEAEATGAPAQEQAPKRQQLRALGSAVR